MRSRAHTSQGVGPLDPLGIECVLRWMASHPRSSSREIAAELFAGRRSGREQVDSLLRVLRGLGLVVAEPAEQRRSSSAPYFRWSLVAAAPSRRVVGCACALGFACDNEDCARDCVDGYEPDEDMRLFLLPREGVR